MQLITPKHANIDYTLHATVWCAQGYKPLCPRAHYCVFRASQCHVEWSHLTVMSSKRSESRHLHSRCPYCSLHDSMNTKIYLFLQQKSINFEGSNGTTDYCKADFER